MKIVTQEEMDAHSWATVKGGINGMLFGSAISVGIYAIAPKRFPKLFTLPWSIRTAVAVIPPAFTTAVNAELASQSFDSEMYSSDFQQRKVLEEHRRWAKLSLADKFVESLSENKYKIITGLWAASMAGSWMYVNKDPFLTKSQKFYAARMYAQFITVGLLLASIGLSVYEEDHHLNQHERSEDAYLREVLDSAKEEELRNEVKAKEKAETKEAPKETKEVKGEAPIVKRAEAEK